MTTTVILPNREATVQEIVGNYVMLVLTMHGIGNHRKVGSDILPSGENEARKDWMAVSKKLMQSDNLSNIEWVQGKCRQFVELRSNPSLVKKGIYILRRDVVEEVIDHVTNDNARIRKESEALRDDWPRLLVQAQLILKNRFNAGDYIDPRLIVGRFSIDYQLFEIKPPDSDMISDKVFREEKAKYVTLWEEAAKNAERLLAVGMVEQVQNMIDKLTPTKDGKARRIRPTALDGINEFLVTSPFRNMTNDRDLRECSDRLRRIIANVDADTLRQSKDARDTVTLGFEQVKQALEAKIEIIGRRAISLED